MPLARRSVRNVSGSIWPGFVDAMTALLLVLMFVLTIFMVVQFVLRETISGQANELDALGAEVADLADALGLARARNAELEAGLGAARDEISTQVALIATLSARADAQAKDIASFEAQVASLIAERDAATARGAKLAANIEDLEAAEARLIDEREALQLALAAARDEVDAGAEAARLAAARREALEALVADLEAKGAAQADALSEAEAARLVDAAAAEALREKLKNADAELTAMTLALEEQRARAEDTLTLLAAAEAARDEALTLNAEGISEAERQAGLLAAANKALAEQESEAAENARKVALLNEQIAALRTQLGALQATLDASDERDAEAQVQIEALGSRLNTALAAVAAEQRARAELEEAERKRLESEAKELAAYRSEFFGKLRNVLDGRDGVRIVGDRFVFSSEVLFAVGDVDLAPEGRAQIARVAEILSDVAADIPPEIDWILRVDGHTDDTPVRGGARYADNWEISQARALSVVRYMIDDLGFEPERLVAAGFGEYQPVEPGNDAAARAANRRIELKLTEK